MSKLLAVKYKGSQALFEIGYIVNCQKTSIWLVMRALRFNSVWRVNNLISDKRDFGVNGMQTSCLLVLDLELTNFWKTNVY